MSYVANDKEQLEQEERRRLFYAAIERVMAQPEPALEVRGPVDPGDGPTPQRSAKASDDVEDFISDSGRRTTRMLDGSVLDLLNKRGSITPDHYVAGVRYYSDAFMAGLCQSAVIDPERIVVDGGMHKGIDDRQLDAQTRWKEATQAVGKIHSRTLVALLLLEESLAVFGLRISGRATSKDCTIAAVTALRLALEELDAHYIKHRPRRAPRMQATHSEGYRPEIQPVDNSGPRDVHDSGIGRATPPETRPARRVSR